MESRQRVVRRIVAVVLVVMLGAAVEVVSVGTASASNPTSCTRTVSGTSGPITVNNGELVCLYRAVINVGNRFAITVNPGGGLVVSSSAITGYIATNQAFFLAVCASTVSLFRVSNSTGPVILGWRAQGCGGNSVSPTGFTASSSTSFRRVGEGSLSTATSSGETDPRTS